MALALGGVASVRFSIVASFFSGVVLRANPTEMIYLSYARVRTRRQRVFVNNLFVEGGNGRRMLMCGKSDSWFGDATAKVPPAGATDSWSGEAWVARHGLSLFQFSTRSTAMKTAMQSSQRARIQNQDLQSGRRD